MAKYLDTWDEFEKHRDGGLGPQDSHDPAYSAQGVLPWRSGAEQRYSKFELASAKHHGVSGTGTKYQSHNYAGIFSRCYHKHPAMPLPGTDKVIYGGSCSEPIVQDADVYIGFAYDMRFTQRNWPWKKGDEVLFRIPDMGIPDKPEEFNKLVDWTKKQIDAGRKVHCGCMGGHGRTGMFLAALVTRYGESDAIEYVRTNYCKTAVESTSQVDFLVKEFGCKKLKHKGYKTTAKSGKNEVTPYTGNNYSAGSKTSYDTSHGVIDSYCPVTSKSNIWGA
jgi:hypothetical protein